MASKLVHLCCFLRHSTNSVLRDETHGENVSSLGSEKLIEKSPEDKTCIHEIRTGIQNKDNS